MKTKICTKCKVEKEVINFNKCAPSKDGFHTHCKNCRTQYSKENGKRNYINNLDNGLKSQKKYKQNNKEKVKESNKRWRQKQKQINPLFTFIRNARKLILRSLKTSNDKTNTKTYQILGCTSNEFKSHLESQFEPWMNWDNYGLYNGQLNYGWDVDHIIPYASAKTEEDAIRLNHHTNLRPRCSYLNRVEDNRKYKKDTTII